MRLRSLHTEFVTPRQPASRKLLIVLHGRGDSAAGFRWLPAALDLPWLGYLLVDAPEPYAPGGRSWYAPPPDQRPGVEHGRERLAALCDELLAAGHRASDIGMLGFSQGCLMTLEFGARSSHPLACYIGISGYCLDPGALATQLTPAARRPVWLVTHGTRDELLPFARTAAQAEDLVRAGLPIEFAAYDKGHTIDSEHELPAIRSFLLRTLAGDPS
ncbi:MAG: serine esterase [Planctomycetes bacterium]|nr:serine esterase [Planctomycetota bacterium]MCB9869305.1 serine esterase [Planctomycetota bacterium]